MEKNFNYKKFTKSFIIFILIGLFLIPTNVLAQAISQEKSAEYYLEILNPYLDIKDDGLVIFDKENAIKNDLDKKIIEYGEDIQQISINYYRYYKGEAITPYGVPIWGNWCGPGYGSGSTIDILDAGCKTHDICYRDAKPASLPCHCDRALISYIDRNYHKMTGSEKAMAQVVKGYFILQKLYCTEVVS